MVKLAAPNGGYMGRVKEMAAWCAKANRGPGAWACPCCRCRGATRAWMKRHMNRAMRRKVRIAVRKEAA